jgi:hypothetical protein
VRNSLADVLSATPVRTIVKQHPHLAGQKPIASHRGKYPGKPPEFLPAYGTPMRGNTDRTARTQADADRAMVRHAAAQAATPPVDVPDMRAVHSLLTRLGVRTDAQDVRIQELLSRLDAIDGAALDGAA